jgi:hypothetical protein
MMVGDVDEDGDLDFLSGGYVEQDRVYLNSTISEPLYCGYGRATSLEVDTKSENISCVRLIPTATNPPNTWIDWFLSNNGGTNWSMVQPYEWFTFPIEGNDLRWRAELHSVVPLLSSEVTEVYIEDYSDDSGSIVSGEININPNNSANDEFILTLPDGSTITRDDLTEDFAGYTGPATSIHVKPKGNGYQNSLMVDGEPCALVNADTYDIVSDQMTV